MNDKEVSQWLKKNKAAYIQMYRLELWDIQWTVENNEEESFSGIIGVQPEYMLAHIGINTAHIHNELDLIETVCHELEHILHAPMNLFYESIASLLPKAQQKLADQWFMIAQEQTRVNIGRFRANILQNKKGRRK